MEEVSEEDLKVLSITEITMLWMSMETMMTVMNMVINIMQKKIQTTITVKTIHQVLCFKVKREELVL